MEKNETKEVIVWKNCEEGVLRIDITTPLKDKKGRLTGKSVMQQEENITPEILRDAIEGLELTFRNLTNQKEDKQRQIDGLGKVPPKTAEIVRLESNLRVSSVHLKFGQLAKQVKDLKEQIADTQKVIMRRKDQLSKAPKK